MFYCMFYFTGDRSLRRHRYEFKDVFAVLTVIHHFSYRAVRATSHYTKTNFSGHLLIRHAMHLL